MIPPKLCPLKKSTTIVQRGSGQTNTTEYFLNCSKKECALWFDEGKDKAGKDEGNCAFLRLAIDIQNFPYDLRQMIVNH